MRDCLSSSALMLLLAELRAPPAQPVCRQALIGQKRHHRRSPVSGFKHPPTTTRQHTQHDKQDRRPWADADSRLARATHPPLRDYEPLHQRERRGAPARLSDPRRPQSDFDRPAKKPRRAPNWGAPTPMPEPSRISYSLSNTLITSKRAVRPSTGPRSKSWLTPRLTTV